MGEDVPASLRKGGSASEPEVQAPLTVRPAITVSVFHVERDIIARSRQIPVLVLLGGPLDPGVARTRKALSAAATAAAGQWVFAWVNADSDPEVIDQFHPESLPRLYAVADGTAIGHTGIAHTEELEAWIDTALTHASARLPGLPPEARFETEPASHAPGERPEIATAGSQPDSHAPSELPETELRAAAEAVATGDYSEALSIYAALQDTASPSDRPVVERAIAAVSVLERAQQRPPSADPIRLADAEPTNPQAALDAADAHIILDQPEAAVRRLIPLTQHPEVRARLLQLLTLLPPNSDELPAARRAIANAVF